LNFSPVSLFPVGSEPFGSSYRVWSAKWWQWLLSIRRSDNPVLDNTGAKAAINQHDPNVFFLCQTIDSTKLNSSMTGSRKVAVKSGTSILIPIINWISVLHEDGETEEELVSIATAKMDVVSKLEVIINGIKMQKGLEQYRARSPFFDMVLPKENILEIPGGSKHFVSDGYWLFLTPLVENTKLSTFGSCSSGVNKFAVDYEIAVFR
jgi:hypothetical protein